MGERQYGNYEYEFYRILQNQITVQYSDFIKGNILSSLLVNEYLELGIALTKFILAKEVMIKKEVKNHKIKTKLMQDQEELDYLFSKEFCDKPPIIDLSKTSVKDNKMIFSSIRNSLAHGSFEMDSDKRVVYIKDDIPGQELYAEISFDWFIKFASIDILEKRQEKKYNMKSLFIDDNVFQMLNKFNDKKEMQDFIDKLVMYNIEIENNDTFSVTEFKDTVNEILENNKYIINTSNPDENYKNSWENMRSLLKSELKKKYPNAKINISKLPTENLSNKIINDYNTKQNDIFTYSTPTQQFRELVRRINSINGHKKTSILKSIDEIIQAQKTYNNEIKNSKEYQNNESGCKDIINYILKDCHKSDVDILKYIHNYRVQNNLPNNYDDIQIGDGQQIKLDRKDKAKIKRYLSIENKEKINLKLSELKNIDNTLYEKYYKTINESNLFISNEDCELFNKDIIIKARNLKEQINEKLEIIQLGLIDIIGFTTFGFNKEKIFDENDSVYYNIVSNMKGFCKGKASKDRTKQKLLKKRRKLTRIKAKKNRTIKYLSRKIKYKNTTPPKLKKQIDKNKEKINEINNQINYLDNQIKLYNNDYKLYGEKWHRASETQIPNIIRNCICHGRIEMIGNGKLKLNDKTHVLYCDVESLFNFVLNISFRENVEKFYDNKKQGKQK